jgi:hypothetical protein
MENPENTLNNLGLTIKHAYVETFNGKLQITCVEVKLNFTLHNYRSNHCFIISDELHSEEAILGFDFIQQHDVSMRGGEIIIYGSSKQPHEVVTCKLATTITIPAHSEMIVQTKSSSYMSMNRLSLFEPFDNSTKGLTFAKSIDNVNHGHTNVLALNYTNSNIILPANSVVGSLMDIKQVMCDLPIEAPIVAKANTVDMVNRTKTDTKSNTKIVYKQLYKLNDKLSKHETAQLTQLLNRYKNVFSWSEYDIGRAKNVDHRINTSDTPPIKNPPYKAPVRQQQIINEKVQEMLDNDLIEPSYSPWSSPVVLIRKKDDSYRFCVDFRKLNHVTIKDAYPLPRMDETLNALTGSKYFSTLDLATGFWQVPLNENDKHKTAFCVKGGLYQFKVMPMGLTNAPGTFQRLMDNILKRFNWKQCLCYLDEIMVFSKDFQSHLRNLENVFTCLQHANLKLKPSKCNFCMDKIVFLGHEISKFGRRPDPNKMKALRDISAPTTITEVKSFLGFISYYRDYVAFLSDLIDPIVLLTHKNVAFIWSNDCETSFNEIKVKLTESPWLALPDFSKEFIMDTDASKKAIGAALAQEHDGIEYAVEFASRRLSKSECNYSTTERELLVIIWGCKHWKSYFFFQKIKIRTDHKPIVQLQNISEPDGRIGRLFLKLQLFNYELCYRPGKYHTNADALSRFNYSVSCNSISIHNGYDWYKEQDMDEELRKIKNNLENGNLDNSTHELCNRRYASSKNKMKISIDNILMLEQRIVLPKHLINEIITNLHSCTIAGHLGIKKTLQRIQKRFYWPSMKHDVVDFIHCCDICQRFKSNNSKPIAPLQPIVADFPFQLINIDVTGPLTTTKRGNRYLIVVVDQFSKWIEAIATPDFTALTTAQFLVNKIICKFGTPSCIYSDKGVNFESSLFKQICNLLHITKFTSTSYHPASNGEVERSNRTTKQMLACYVNDHHDDWDEYVDQLCFAYNTSTHESTNLSPFEIIRGQPAVLPIDIAKPINVIEVENISGIDKSIAALAILISSDFKFTSRTLDVQHFFTGISLECPTNIQCGDCIVNTRNGKTIIFLIVNDKHWLKPRFESVETALQLLKGKLDELLITEICVVQMHQMLDWSAFKRIIHSNLFDVKAKVSIINKAYEPHPSSQVHDYVDNFKTKQLELNTLVRKHDARAKSKQRFYYNRHTHTKTTYNVGDLVLLTNHQMPIGHTKSFRQKQIGPYKIEQILSDLTYRVSRNGKSITVHYNRMQPYCQRAQIDNSNPCLNQHQPLNQILTSEEQVTTLSKQSNNNEQAETRRHKKRGVHKENLHQQPPMTTNQSVPYVTRYGRRTTRRSV